MGTSLGELLSKAGLQASEASEVEPAASAGEAVVPTFAAKVVVRRTKKGRGGRTVTLVQGVKAGREELLAKIKKQLGVGARLDEDDLVIQGDQVERVARWIESQEGVRKVVRS